MKRVYPYLHIIDKYAPGRAYYLTTVGTPIVIKTMRSGQNYNELLETHVANAVNQLLADRHMIYAAIDEQKHVQGVRKRAQNMDTAQGNGALADRGGTE